MKISVSMITLNEAWHIGRSLSSCSFADEIVVVDGGSTDGTLDILRSHEKVILVQYPWEGHFGKQRQISHENCSGDWVIRLDADEVFSAEFERNIRTLLESTVADIVGYKVRGCNLIRNEIYYARACDGHEYSPRIYRKLPGVKWERHVHEIPVGLNGKICFWDVYVVHYGFLYKKRFREKGLFYSNIPGSGVNTPEELYFRDYDIQPRPYRATVASHVLPFEIEEEDNGLLKVAIVRGPNLNPWEIQNYEPLTARFDITAYTTTKPNFGISEIKLPVDKLPAHPDHPAYMMGLEFALFDKDLIYTADTTWVFSYQAILVKEKFGTPVVCLQWENIPFAYEEDEQMRTMKLRVRQEADHFIAVTERAKDALILEGVSPEKITVIPLGIDVERFKPDRSSGLEFRREFGIGIEEKVILFTGRIVWEKGIYDLVYAAKLALQELQGTAARFVVVGKGHELKAVKERVRELAIEDSFVFIENCSYNKIHRMYNLADIFVLPSISTRMWKEQFGMVLIEAMACGVPVISTCSGSIPEVVSDAGVLVQSNDPCSLAAAIVDLVIDDEARQCLGQKGRKRVEEEFNSRKISDKVGGLFKTLLRNSAKHSKGRQPSYNKELNSCEKVTWEFPAGQSKSKPGNETFDAVSTSIVAGKGGYHSQERKDVETLIPNGTKRILDVGCGEGILGRRLLEKGASEVVGIEFSPDACERAEKNLTGVICGDIEEFDLLFDEGYFDCLILADILEHLRDPLSTLKKLRKHLSDSGVVVASIPNVRYYGIIKMLVEGHWSYEDCGILDRTHLRFFTKKEVEALFAEAGFEITGITSNIDPAYNSLSDPLSGEISFGRVSLSSLAPEELKDLFVFQYLIKAQKTGVEVRRLNDAVKTAIEAGNPDTAKKVLEEYLAIHPADTDVLFRYAEVCCKMGLVDKAGESLEKILIFEPDREDALGLRRFVEEAC